LTLYKIADGYNTQNCIAGLQKTHELLGVLGNWQGASLPIKNAIWRNSFSALLGILGNPLNQIIKLKYDIYKEILICDNYNGAIFRAMPKLPKPPKPLNWPPYAIAWVALATGAMGACFKIA